MSCSLISENWAIDKIKCQFFYNPNCMHRLGDLIICYAKPLVPNELFLLFNTY